MSEGFVADASVGVAWAVYAQASLATDQLLDLELAIRRRLALASRDAALCKPAQGCRVKLLL